MAKRRRLTATELRAKYAGARRDLSKLKAKGLISKRANLRKAKPSSALLKKLDRLGPVLTGHAQAVKLTPVQRKDFKEAGFPIYGKFTVFDKQPGEKIAINKNNEVVVKSPDNRPGFVQVILPVNVRNFAAFYEWITDKPEELDAMLSPYAYFGFSFYGNHSHNTGDAEWLREYLRHYKPLFGENEDGSGVKAEDADAAFRSLLLFRLADTATADVFANQRKERSQVGKMKTPKTIQDRRLDKRRRQYAMGTLEERHAASQRKYVSNKKLTLQDKIERAARQKAYRQRVKSNAVKKS